MKRLAGPGAILFAVGLLLLAAVHVVMFGFAMQRLALPAALAVAAVMLALAAHLGLLAPLGAWLGRRAHHAGKREVAALEGEPGVEPRAPPPM